MRMTVETVATSKRRQGSPRCCLTASTSSRPEICSATLMAKLSPTASSKPRRLISSFSALEDGVCIAERGGQRVVGKIVETGCDRGIGSLSHGHLHWLGLGRAGCYQHLARPTIFWYAKFMSMSISRTGKKRGRGRPSTGAISVHLRILPSEIARIDAWSARQEDSPSRPEAIRRLVEQALSNIRKGRAR